MANPSKISWTEFQAFGFYFKKRSIFYCSKFASIHSRTTFALPKRGSIAQLVQSICLTSRGSGVRIPLLPHKKSRSNVAFLRFKGVRFIVSLQKKNQIWDELNHLNHLENLGSAMRQVVSTIPDKQFSAMSQVSSDLSRKPCWCDEPSLIWTIQKTLLVPWTKLSEPFKQIPCCDEPSLIAGWLRHFRA